jgi:hypothetical protein
MPIKGLNFIVDKTLAEKYKTEYISDGVIKYFVNELISPDFSLISFIISKHISIVLLTHLFGHWSILM